MAVLAGVVKNGKLVSKKAWENYIAGLKSGAAPAAKNKSLIKKQLKQKLIEAVASRMPGQKFGIMLSGGVDSSLLAFICRKLNGDFICYSVGTEKSKDVAEAKKAAKKLNLKLRYKIFTEKEAEALIKEAVAVIGKPDVVSVGIAAVALAAAKLARKDGISTFFTGLGSEEIFAGYQRHEKARNANEECWNGLRAMWERDFLRDRNVATAMNVSFLTPFLDKDLIIAAMSIPSKYKISGSSKKIILREAAEEMGLPRRFAFRKKLAAQYGSGFDKAIEKLATKNGFRHKRDYLASIPAQIHYSSGQFFRRKN